MNSFIFKFFLFEDFCLEDFTRSREDKTIWSERPRYTEYCRKHCLPSKIKIEWMTEEEMLWEPKEQRHVFGMAVFHDEDGEDISLRLIDHYKDYADIFSEEKIHALPEHSKYDHKI